VEPFETLLYLSVWIVPVQHITYPQLWQQWY